MPSDLSYAEWLTPERLAVEEKLWGEEVAQGRGNAQYARCVHRAMRMAGVCHVWEYGCGTGWMPLCLTREMPDTRWNYTGIDANFDCARTAKERMEKAGSRPRGLEILWQDFRQALRDAGKKSRGNRLDRVCPSLTICSFAVLKHFALREIDLVTRGLIRLSGPMGLCVFSMPIAKTDTQDGSEFVHTRITREHLEQIVRDTGRVIVCEEPIIGSEGQEIIFTVGAPA